MTDRERILAEARANVASKEDLQRDIARRQFEQQQVDPLTTWRADAAKFEREVEAATLERKRLEREGLRQRDVDTINNRFAEMLAAYLPSHLDPLVSEISDAVVGAIDALHQRAIEREEAMQKMRDEVIDLKIELAKLATTLADLRSTDRALGGVIPGVVTRSVN